MMTTIAVEATIIVILVLVNGLLAMSEMAIVSARKARLRQLAELGDEGAQTALALADTPSDFLAAVQIGITLVGVLAGAFGGATIAEELSKFLAEVPALAEYSEAIGLGVVVVAITFLSLVIGELVPKRIALGNAERMAAAVARPIHLLTRLAKPAVRGLGIATDWTLAALRLKPAPDPPVSEEEVNIMMEQGTQAGVFEKDEERMVKRVLRLGDRRVGELMTPRVQLISLDVAAPFRENLTKIVESQHSHFPVYQARPDNLIGIVSAKSVIEQLALKGNDAVDLGQCLSEPLYVAETMPILMLLEHLKRQAKHLALVVNEYGGTAGIVTIVDVLEAIVGDLPAEDALADAGIVMRDDGSWLIDGLLPIDEFEDLLEHLGLAGRVGGDFQTVAGFVMARMAKIPNVGEHFDWQGLRIEVVDMDGRRIDKLLLAAKAEDEDTDP